MSKIKCPFYTRKVSGYNYKGIKCTSPKWHTGIIIGNVTNWNEEKRENHINTYCKGCFSECTQYKNHIENFK